MHQRQDAGDPAIAFGEQEVRIEAENIAKDRAPSRAMKKRTRFRRLYECVPFGGTTVRRAGAGCGRHDVQNDLVTPTVTRTSVRSPLENPTRLSDRLWRTEASALNDNVSLAR